jgi:HPt (histidine-containing phosphotransfer) domain-containing protein
MSGEPVFDAAHLDRQTMGDEALRVEILALFVTEVERLMAQVEAAPDPLVRASRLHAITGLARNVGAQRLAVLCRGLQERVARGAAEEDDLADLRAAVEEAVGYIHDGAV